MKKIIFILMLPVFLIGRPCHSQLLERNEDVSEKGFSTKDFLSLDADFAIELAEQKAKTLIRSLANQAAAAAPLVGTAGVAAELGLTNLKFDEMIVADKQYNYKLSALLGNILKVSKEARDGTYKSRSTAAARKIKIIDKSIKAVSKCKKTKDALSELKKKGWNTSTMKRALKALDASLLALEEVGDIMLTSYNSSDAEQRAIDNSEKVLNDVNTIMDEMYANALKELNENVSAKYNFEYNSALLTGAFYCQDLTKAEAREKVYTNMKKSHNALITFKRIMWSVCILFFLVAATGYIWKIYLAGEDGRESNLFIKYSTSWVIGFFITLIIGGLLEQFISSIQY